MWSADIGERGLGLAHSRNRIRRNLWFLNRMQSKPISILPLRNMSETSDLNLSENLHVLRTTDSVISFQEAANQFKISPAIVAEIIHTARDWKMSVIHQPHAVVWPWMKGQTIILPRKAKKRNTRWKHFQITPQNGDAPLDVSWQKSGYGSLLISETNETTTQS